eukprot:TRINITY_DN391_c0_g1_i1.p2 TRINITY_DN391_c0_g1~~TRINITY_DN391_c0_g1_i1.p2  ORF type:complete len:338 (-),score=75.22 TRINITY_DN391_c0_g1_i1:22-1035(-)
MKLTPIFVLLACVAAYWYYDKGDNGHHVYTTAEEVAEGLDLTGRVAIVTGANSGIGWETSRILAWKGAKVVVAARSLEKAQKAADSIRAYYPGQSLDLIPLAVDLESLVSVEKFADSFLELNIPLHMLILNAGVMAIPERTTTKFGVETQMGVNHVAHFYLAKLLDKKLEESAPSRVVSVSSFAEVASSPKCLENPNLECDEYNPWTAYGNSKLANVLFAKEFQKRNNGKVVAVSVHPGCIATNLQRHMEGISLNSLNVLSLVFKNPTQGAATTIYAATSPEIFTKNLGGSFLANAHASRTTSPFWVEWDEEGVHSKRFWEATEALLARSLEVEKRG